MKLNELQQLLGGDIFHTRYGLCELREIMYSFGDFFGAVIHPKTAEGQDRLKADAGTDIPQFMEDSLRRLKMPAQQN